MVVFCYYIGNLWVTKDFILSREKFYLDWALKTYGAAILNMLNEPGSSLGFKHTEETVLKWNEKRWK